MLLWEAGTLVASILIGGGVIAWYLYQERKLSRALQLFFMSFAHELRTPVAAIRLKLESLQDQSADERESEALGSLQQDATRLMSVLENSLYLSQLKERVFSRDSVGVSSLVRQLQSEWPHLILELHGDANVNADRRALEVVLRNLVNNSATHGHAKSVEIVVAPSGERRVTIDVVDDGRGYDGDPSSIGKTFGSSYVGSSTGVGLFLVREMMSRMKGDFSVLPTNEGFAVRLELMRGEPES